MAQFTRRNFSALLFAGPQISYAFTREPIINGKISESAQRLGIPALVAYAVNAKEGLAYTAYRADADSIFQIASMTKPITSVAALQLVDQGKITLDEPVAKFLPKLANPQVLDGFTPAGDPILRPAKTPITLRHLLTHTSGISYPTWHANMNRYAQRAGLGPTSIAPVVPLMFDPGTNWQYGYSIDWVGRFVETITGLTLQQYFRQHILDPLNMKDTDFGVPASKFDRMVAVYNRTPDGKFNGGARTQPQPPTDFNGGGGLSSTANDYAKFAQMLLRKGKGEGNVQILKPATVDMLFKNQIGKIRAGAMKTMQPNVSADVDTHPGGADHWGLVGLWHGPGAKGIRSEGSTGWAGIYNTFFWVDPKKHIAGVVMMQYLPFFDPEAVGLLTDFERAVYASV